MSKQGKVWGVTEEIFNNNIVSAHAITIKKGGYCSIHKHAHKSNIFFVISGKLKILIYNDNGIIDETILTSDSGICVVQKMQKHKFEALENTQAIELYEVRMDGDDIIRDDVGGNGDIIKHTYQGG